MISRLGISATVTAFDRVDQTIVTLARIKACIPPPDEILVHVDGNREDCADAIRLAHQDVTLIFSEASVGPGGGRNKLVAAARNELVASFDDDSYPIDIDYFERVQRIASSEIAAAVISASVFHPEETIGTDRQVATCVASFVSCGSVFRRQAFLEAGGFLPLVVAYGMEEEDLSLRLHDRGLEVVHTPWLRVFHDADRRRHAHPRVNAGVIANLALLVYLRYPPRYWPYGLLQLANRVFWCLRAGRLAGILSGLLSIPRHLYRYRGYRSPVTVEALRRRFAARNSAERPLGADSAANAIGPMDASSA